MKNLQLKCVRGVLQTVAATPQTNGIALHSIPYFGDDHRTQAKKRRKKKIFKVCSQVCLGKARRISSGQIGTTLGSLPFRQFMPWEK